jgi:hypothetical protein
VPFSTVRSPKIKINPPSYHAEIDRTEAAMKLKPRCDRKVSLEKEEYEALMAELPTLEFESKPAPDAPELADRLRKLEYYMMIIVGLVLVVLMLGKGH